MFSCNSKRQDRYGILPIRDIVLQWTGFATFIAGLPMKYELIGGLAQRIGTMNDDTEMKAIPLDDDYVCWDAENHRVYLANETGALIMQWHGLGWTEQAMAQELAQRYGLATHDVVEDVSAQLRAMDSNSLPIVDSEFGLINSDKLSERHRCIEGNRYRLWCGNTGGQVSEAFLPDLYLVTEVAGLAEQIARVFHLPFLPVSVKQTAEEPAQGLAHSGGFIRKEDRTDSNPKRGIQRVPNCLKEAGQDTDSPMDDKHLRDIVVGQVGNCYFIAEGGRLVAEYDNLSSLLHHCVGVINTRWTVSRVHNVVLHAAAVSLGERAVIMPAASGSGKSTLATWLALQGWTFWGDDLIALAANAQAVVPSVACASVKAGSRSVVFDSESAKEESGLYSGYGNEGAHKVASAPPIGILTENPRALTGGWNEQSIMLEQVRAPAHCLSPVPGCFLFPHFDKRCKTLEVTPLGSADAFRRIVSAGLATDFTSSSGGLEALCSLLGSCRKIQVRYGCCEDVREFLMDLEV